MVLYSGRKVSQNLAKLVGLTSDPNSINVLILVMMHFFQKKKGGKKIKYVPESKS